MEGIFVGAVSEQRRSNVGATKEPKPSLFRTPFSPLQQAVKIADVSGEMYLNQTGHLLTVIDGENNFEYYLFKADTNEYRHIIVDENGKPSDRNLYPFGQVHFNFRLSPSARICEAGASFSEDEFKTEEGVRSVFGHSICKDKRTELYGKMRKKNKFTNNPFLVCAALKLYDGSFMYATNPVYMSANELHRNSIYLMTPREWGLADYQDGTNPGVSYYASYLPKARVTENDVKDDVFLYNITRYRNYIGYNKGVPPCFSASMSSLLGSNHNYTPYFALNGYDLACTISQDVRDLLNNNKDVFVSVCIFITQPAELYESDFTTYELNDPRIRGQYRTIEQWKENTSTQIWHAVTYNPIVRSDEDIAYDLTHSPFYLLKEYKIEDADKLVGTFTIDLSKPEDDGVLDTLTTRVDTVLTSESVTRTTYLPRVQYNYNGRLHIADYSTKFFHGYPLDLFQQSNRFIDEHGKQIFGYQFDEKTPLTDDPVPSKDLGNLITILQNNDLGSATAYIEVTINTENGDRKVVRYIDGELLAFTLNPFLCYPDCRAKEMHIFVQNYRYSQSDHLYVVEVREARLPLRQLPTLNMAYYFNWHNTPIEIFKIGAFEPSFYLEIPEGRGDTPTDFSALNANLPIYLPAPTESATERFPNGLKVSKTDNPLFFPVENTYQVGSSQVLALCSNAVAVGTGQTGVAPLYIFCTDGIYALFIDSEGKMAYTNARVLARDVLNNKRSVVPTDLGVAFTTDRGLMLIAGEQVQEIGQPLEGDIVPFQDPEGVGYSKIATNAYVLYNLANINPTSLPNEHFLQYLKGAIIAYNHNERELMVSNPNTEYSYVLGAGQWTRRDYSADEYTLCYPTCYRLRDGELYQLDNQTDRENGFFVMTRGLKLDSIGFKELHRVVARGTFSTTAPVAERYANYLGLYVFGSYDGYKWACLGHREKAGSFNDIGCLVERTDCRFFRLVLAGQLRASSRLDYFELSSRPSRLNTKIR